MLYSVLSSCIRTQTLSFADTPSKILFTYKEHNSLWPNSSLVLRFLYHTHTHTHTR